MQHFMDEELAFIKCLLMIVSLHVLQRTEWGSSIKYPQSVLLSQNKKNNVYPCRSHFFPNKGRGWRAREAGWALLGPRCLLHGHGSVMIVTLTWSDQSLYCHHEPWIDLKLSAEDYTELLHRLMWWLIGQTWAYVL